ncbi:hypothetical protein B0H19DRAFT_61726 [Mycena capillaripes]|nr:hypothetical protein B0H19DRAFT_61726 [Mycena capillaripes]
MAVSSYRLNASSNASATDSAFSALDMHSRNYSYPPPGYTGGNSGSPPPASGYSPTYEQSSGRPYFPPPSNTRVGHQPTQYYTPIAPAPPSSNYRPSEYSSPAPYPPSQYPPENRGSSYPSNQPGSSSYPFNARASSPLNGPPISYHRHSSTAQPQPRSFIPTPSEAYANPSHPPRPPSAMHRGSGHYSGTPHPAPPSSSRPPHQSGSSRPRSSMSNPPMTTSSGERFICEVCGKDFSRAHDRKRHHETQHAATPVTHKCVYCEKDFSRCGLRVLSFFSFQSQRDILQSGFIETTYPKRMR